MVEKEAPENQGRRTRPIIAIDGPAASGKSTVGRKVAARLGFLYIDTGSLYRAAAWLAGEHGISPEDPAGLARLIDESEIRLENVGGKRRVTVDGRDISGELRSEAIGGLASTFSALPEVRRSLLGIQKRLGDSGGVVMDGRDIGTVIFPDAEVKVFLTAGDEERSRRRWLELKERGMTLSLEEVAEDLHRRDEQDRGRDHAPLKAAPGALVIDSTGLSADEVAGRILDLVFRERAGGEGSPVSRPPAGTPKKHLKVAVLYRKLDLRFKRNFPNDIEGREDESYLEEILGALRRRGHDAYGYAIREDALQDLQNLDCDLAFNIVEEGLNNNSSLEPHLPALLDVFGIPYTGGDFLSIALTADKARTKEILSYHRVPTPAFQLFESPKEEVRRDLRFPLIVKPLREDAGIGIFLDSVVRDPVSLRRRVRKVLKTYKQPALVEEYIHGRELSVAVFEHRGKLHVSPLSEVVFYTRPGKPRVYTYKAKWDDESTEYENVDPTDCPAEDIEEEIAEEVRRLAVLTFRTLRLRGYARVDFRLSEEDRLYVFEVNVNPLIGEESLMAVLARNMGWYFPTFINNIVMEAYRRSLREMRGVTLRDFRDGAVPAGPGTPPTNS
jgi:cytidylate kinase